MSDFATILTNRRKELGLSQGELAKRLHVTRQAVSKWENGKGIPDVNILTNMSEVLGISTDEMLKGKEPEKQVVERVVEKEVIREVEKEVIKEVTKPMPFRKILAIVAPIVLVIVLASALMGVYIPKAIEKPPIQDVPEPNIPPEIIYYDVEVIASNVDRMDTPNHSSSIFQAPTLNGVAYYKFSPLFNSDYTIYIVAPVKAKIKIDENEYVYIQTDEEFAYTTYMTKESTHYIEINLTECGEDFYYWSNPSIRICQKLGYDNVLVRADSDYTFCIERPYSLSELNHYTIQNKDIYFTSMQRIYRQSIPIDGPYPGHPSWNADYYDYRGACMSCDVNVGVQDMQFINEYATGEGFNGSGEYFCTVHNNSDKDVMLDIVEPSFEVLPLNTIFNFQSTNDANFIKVNSMSAEGDGFYPNIYLYINKKHSINVDVLMYTPDFKNWLTISEYFPIWANEDWMCFYMQGVTVISFLRIFPKPFSGGDYKIELFFSNSNPYKLFGIAQ